MEANPGPPRGRAGAGFDRDMQDFLINMEVAAKTIIKRDTKRRMAEAKRVSQMQLLMSASGSTVRMDDSNSSPSRKRRLKEAGGHGSVVVVNPTLAPLNPAANMGPMTFDRRAMSVSVSKIPSDQKVLHMGHSGPSTTMAATTLLHADPGTQLDKTRGLMPQGKPSTPPAHGAQASQSSPLPPLRRSAQIKQQMRAMALQTQETDNLHPTLFANPLYKPPAQVKVRRRQIGTDAQLFAAGKEGAKGGHASSELKPRKDRRIEPQGPVSWGSDDLRIKYRHEASREEAWAASQATEAAAEKLRLTEGVIVPYALVERHPLYIAYFDLVRSEFRRAIERARQRNRMKRFVSDVHTLWLTNLAALREHSMQRYDPAPRGLGLDDRRDTSAISSMSSQIPSVSKDRAIRNAAYPSHAAPVPLPSPTHFPRQTPLLPPPPPEPPRLWTLVDCEPIVIRPLRRTFNCFVHRLQPLPRNGAPSAALWRVGMYDVINGEGMHLVVKEEEVVSSVRRNILRGGGMGGGFGDDKARRREWVHKQGCRVPWGEGSGSIPSLVTITISSGPHDSVLVDMLSTPIHAPFSHAGPQRVRLTSHEVIARLGLLDAPALDLGFWKGTRGRQEIWRTLTTLLRYRKAESPSASPEAMLEGACLDDRVVRQQEGFDFYGMLANGYALLPLLRVTPHQGRKDVGHGMAIPDVTPVTEEVKAKETREWEDRADFNLPMSLRVCGRVNGLTRVPGTCEWGKAGLWYPSPFPLALREYTQGVMSFFRDPGMSSTDSVLALRTLSLDTPCMAPVSMAWDAESASPYPPPDEPPDGVVPALILRPHWLSSTPIISSADNKKGSTIVLLTAAARELDYKADGLADPSKQGEHRRLSPWHDADRFRLVDRYPLLSPNGHTPTYIFGVTMKGASSNTTRTTGRYIWHSDQRCVEEIVQQRNPKDYAYVSKKVETAGCNEPQVFTVFTKGGKFHRMVHGGFKALLLEYERLRKKEDKARKEAAIQAKMAAAYAKVEGTRKAEAMLGDKAREKDMGRHLRHGGKRAVSSLERWQKRLAHSVLLATRGVWEKRRHVGSDNVFYFNTNKNEVHAFSYDPPSQDWVQAEAGGGGGRGEEGREGQGAVVAYDGTSTITTAESFADTHTNGTMAETVLTSGESVGEGGGVMVVRGEEGEEEGKSQDRAKLLEDLGKRQSRKLEEVLESMAANPLLIDQLAEKLGAQAFVPLLKRDATVEPLQRELEEDERAWSDSDDEVGDDEYEPGYILQDWGAKFQADKAERALFPKEQPLPKVGRPPLVPALPLQHALPATTTNLEAHTLGRGWRRLPRPEVRGGFVANMLRRRTEGATSKDLNTPSKPTIVPARSPADLGLVSVRRSWVDDYTTEQRFVPNVLQDVEMNVEMIQARLERETRLARGGGLAQIVASGAVDSYSQAVANTGSVGSSSEADSADRLYKAERRALAAVSAGDFEKMEAAVDDDKIDVNTADEHGNTLLILAAQQGNKRMVKFLLRRGANMNAQNFAGNSALHYANAYNHQDLASYLETKGCDSTMLNAAGLTCYEGLRQEDVNEL